MQKPVLTNFVRPVADLVACLLFLITGLGQNVVVQALSQEDLNSIYNDTVWYEPTACMANSSETGSGPLFGLQFPDVSSPNDLATRINSVIANSFPSSPFIGTGNLFVAAGQKYNVNPALVAGIAGKEDGFGTADQPVVKVNKNAFGYGPISGYPSNGGYAVFPSFEASIDIVTKQISQDYVQQGGAYYSTTVLGMMQHYTPPNPEGAAAATLSFMHKILDGIAEEGSSGFSTGSASNGSPVSFTPGSTSDSQCQSTSGYQAGANGYDLSGPNAMAHFYQCDPRWGDQPYGYNSGGSPKTSICAGGCGITSLAMVIATLSNSDETPLTLAKKYGNTYHTDGTSWALWPVAARDYGLQEKDIGVDFNQAAATIRKGGLVIIAVNSGGGNYFTSNSHLMVIRAVDSQGNFYLADPNEPGNKVKGYDTETQGYSSDFLRNHGLMNLFAFTK